MCPVEIVLVIEQVCVSQMLLNKSIAITNILILTTVSQFRRQKYFVTGCIDENENDEL